MLHRTVLPSESFERRGKVVGVSIIAILKPPKEAGLFSCTMYPYGVTNFAEG